MHSAKKCTQCKTRKNSKKGESLSSNIYILYIIQYDVKTEQTKEKNRVRCKKYYLKGGKEKKYERVLKYRYGLTLVAYAELLKKQNGFCAICKGNRSKIKRKLSVDHCHNTGKVRGLLCHICNSGIGLFNDKTDLLKQAYEYLVKNG